MLAENEGRWESLGEADRERLAAMAKAIASRLLHEPTLRMKRSAGSDDAYLYVSALRELFGLDAETEPEGEARQSDRAAEAQSRQEFHLTFFEQSLAVAKRRKKSTRRSTPTGIGANPDALR